MTIAIESHVPPCAHEPDLFEEVAAAASVGASPVPAVTQRLADAHRSCAGCPMLVDCLYRAVVEVDVSGFVACTTEADRAEIRRQLGIELVQSTSKDWQRLAKTFVRAYLRSRAHSVVCSGQ